MGDDLQDVLEAQQIERTLRRAIEVVSHPIWEQEWDGMFRRDELLEELEELAKRPRDLLAATNDAWVARASAKESREWADGMSEELAEKKLSLEVARAEIARLKEGGAEAPPPSGPGREKLAGLKPRPPEGLPSGRDTGGRQ